MLGRHKVLLITQTASEKIGTVRDHVEALVGGLDADVFKVDCSVASLLNLGAFDIVILHYSLVIVSPSYISIELAGKLRAFDGLTILFIQDEYRWIDRTAVAMRDLSVDVVFSLVHPAIVRKIYHHPWCDRIRFEHTLTGFVSAELAELPVIPYEQRTLDVGYRARKLPTWYGRHSKQKWQIAERFLLDAKQYNLKVDIATDEGSRIYDRQWIKFLGSCRSVLGTESGASVCDFSGDIQTKVENHIATNPDVTDEELQALYIGDVDGRIVMNVISPRCFEAAAMRTLMIMYPGEYNGILKPGRHYVLLQPDHSNIEEVIAVLRSPERAMEIIRMAYDEVVLSGRWTHKTLIDQVNKVIREHAGVPSARGLFPAEFALVKFWRFVSRRQAASIRAVLLFKAAGLATRFAAWAYTTIDKLPPRVREWVMPAARNTWRLLKRKIKRAFLGP